MRESESWKFAVVSDTHGGRFDEGCFNKPVTEKIAADILYEKADIVLVSGDLVNGWVWNHDMEYREEYDQWKTAMKPLYDAGIRIYPVRGNHDEGPERTVLPPLPAALEPPEGFAEKLKKAFLDAFNEYDYIPENGPECGKRLEYSFVHKNVFFTGIDVYSSGQHRVNEDWIKRQLTSIRLPHVIVFGHEPAFEINFQDNLSWYEEERNRFWDMLGSSGCRVYFCGHDHLYNRAVIKDSKGHEIRQITAGTGGGPLREWGGYYRNTLVKNEAHVEGIHGYIIGKVDGLSMTIEWKGVDEKEKSGFRVMDSVSWEVKEPVPAG